MQTSEFRGICLVEKQWSVPESFRKAITSANLELLIGEETVQEGILFLTHNVSIYRTMENARKPVVFVNATNEMSMAEIPWDVKEIVTDLWEFSPKELQHVYERRMQLPVTVIETERLIIRETITEDLGVLKEIYREVADNEMIQPLFAGDVNEKSLAEYRKYQYEFYGFGMWTVCLRKDGTVIGRIGFEPTEDSGVLNLGYVISKEQHNRGYAKEAVKALILVAQDEKWGNVIRIETKDNNLPACRIAEALSFRKIEDTREIRRYERNINL